MLKKRIIPCLDIKDGRTVKGVQFQNIKDAGDPLELAKRYSDEGADELVFLDITATLEKRQTLVKLVEQMASKIRIPFTVGGGINSLADAEAVIRAGADKISLNSAAVKRPELITEIAEAFGSQCVVVAIDTKLVEDQWKVFVNAGKTETPLNTVDWAKRAFNLGAGELLLTSMNHDGSRNGFALPILKDVAATVNIPVIASGGAGTREHFAEVFEQTSVSAALAAGIFHESVVNISEVKSYLKTLNIPIR
ncbi:imidazole glycerol phosphate synthase subunit HisF [Flavobacterium aurantiibacter]|uniref:Imidazole glycerol phosphate synthase subunit HisF n=1 Tax=Flavobacterium aurantiibacter TaxID=2023067 RepID=A0A255ZTT5_9FLAO|nr:imidazole glycerol phosphate synthase subunit HisF [Flavobacterium aurantiibacter]OYQ44846.1 imidazole glycerol phosphate synthase subunit HisF [Flavobacterium aurantiibacter]